MTPTKGIMTKKQGNEAFDQEKLFICLTLLENPARVRIFFSWQGPYKVTARLLKLNYRVVNQQGKEFVVHLNRMKRAFKQGIWKAKERERCSRNSRERQQEREEEEQVEIAHRSVAIPVPLEGKRQQVPGTPKVRGEIWTPLPQPHNSTNFNNEKRSNICSFRRPSREANSGQRASILLSLDFSQDYLRSREKLSKLASRQ
jgi:hypothetical protein